MNLGAVAFVAFGVNMKHDGKDEYIKDGKHAVKFEYI